MPRKSKQATIADDIHGAIRAGLPPHIQQRRGQQSVLGEALKVLGDGNWNRAICPETGEFMEHPDRGAGRIAANHHRKQAALERALDVRKRYGDLLDSREGTARIARLEGVDPRTVRRWRQRLEKNGQA